MKSKIVKTHVLGSPQAPQPGAGLMGLYQKNQPRRGEAGRGWRSRSFALAGVEEICSPHGLLQPRMKKVPEKVGERQALSNGARVYRWAVARAPHLWETNAACAEFEVHPRTIRHWKRAIREDSKNGNMLPTAATGPVERQPVAVSATSDRSRQPVAAPPKRQPVAARRQPVAESVKGGSVGGNTASKSPKPKTKKKAADPDQPARKELMAHWQAEWASSRPAEYVPVAKDWVALKKVYGMSGKNAEEVRKRMNHLLISQDSWVAENASLSLLSSKWNQLSYIPGAAKAASSKQRSFMDIALEARNGKP